MKRTENEKIDAHGRNWRAALNLQVAINQFRKQLESGDTECLDTRYSDQLIEVRGNMLEVMKTMNPVIDEGIKSISAQSVSGRLSRTIN